MSLNNKSDVSSIDYSYSFKFKYLCFAARVAGPETADCEP